MSQQQQPVTGYYADPSYITQAMGMPQPAQQVFQRPSPQNPPASTVQAMGQQQGQQQQWQQVPVQPMNGMGNVLYHAQVAQPQQPIQTVTQEEFNRRVEELAENKFKIRAQEVINNAIAAMEGVQNKMGLFGNDNNQQQQQGQYQPSFWDTTPGKITIGTGGGVAGIAGYKLFNRIFGGNTSSYSPSPQEFGTAFEALKTLFR